METDSSLPIAQKPAKCSYTDQINPIDTIPTNFFKIRFNIILPLRLGLPCGLFPSGSTYKH